MRIVTKFTGGEGFDLYSLVEDQKVFIREFIESLGEQDRKQVLRILEFLRDKGDPHNIQKFRMIKGSDEIWEVKTKNIRILCFKSEPAESDTEPLLKKSLILLTGHEKRAVAKPQRLKRAVGKAESLRKEYFGGDIKIINT